MQIYIGVDERQPVAFTALATSIMWRSSEPVSITPLIIEQLPIKRRGLTSFTYSRYLVPWLMGYKGTALFLDADMLVTGDIAELFSLADPEYGVQVVKGSRRFEWPSLMLFNCEKCTRLTPQYIDSEVNHPQSLDWARVGGLPAEWNHCIGYDAPLAGDLAKLLHYTAGIPVFDQTIKLGHKDKWDEARKYANSTVSWEDLMGTSVHTEVVNR